MTVYTDEEKMAAYLGMTFTSAQDDQAIAMAAAASDFIERALGRTFLATDGVTVEEVADERHTVRGNRLWLEHTPVDAITEIKVRLPYAGATEYELTQSYQYELAEPEFGLVYLSPTYEGQRLTVTYDSLQQVPPIIAQFATELAAGMLALSLSGAAGATAALSGVKRYTLWGGDLSVEYATTSSSATSNSASGSTRLPALWEQIEALFSRKLAVA